MSTTLLTAALIGTALLQGAEPNAEEPKKETAAAEAPMEQGKEAPADTESTADGADGQKAEAEKPKDEATGTEATDPEGVDRPSESGATETKRVGAFWFISIGK